MFSQTANKQEEAILAIGVCSSQARSALLQQDRMGVPGDAWGGAGVAWEYVSDQECLNSSGQKQLISTEHLRNW